MDFSWPTFTLVSSRSPMDSWRNDNSHNRGKLELLPRTYRHVDCNCSKTKAIHKNIEACCWMAQRMMLDWEVWRLCVIFVRVGRKNGSCKKLKVLLCLESDEAAALLRYISSHFPLWILSALYKA